MDIEQISLGATAIRDRLLPQLGPDALAQLNAFVDEAERTSAYDAYKVFPAGTRRIVDAQRSQGGDPSVRIFLRAAIAQCLLRTLSSPRLAALPLRVRMQQLAQFGRIAADDSLAEWLDLNQDLFQKEFGIAALRLYVAGCQLVDPRCGIPRSVLVRGNVFDWMRNAMMVVRLGGYRPYFEIHAHTFMLDLFSEEGRNECYRCCAELYALHPAALGMVAGSWFYDPALTEISPRLAYLRSVPQQAGAYLLFIEAGGDALANALATSPTRKQLYKQGKYLPKTYMIVWGKKAQQAWARALPDSHAVAV